MSEGLNRWMLQLPETIDWGVDIACGCNCHCLCVWFFSAARIHSGFVMIVRASGLGMGVGKYSRLLRGMRVLVMPDAGLHTTWCIESVCMVSPGAGVLQLFLCSMAVGVFINCRCVADGVEVTRLLISATRELFSDDTGLELWSWIVEGMELPSCEESLPPAGTEMRHSTGGSREISEAPCFCWFWQLATLGTLRITWVLSGWGLCEGRVRYRCSMFRRFE